jgi:phage tail protein X
VEGRDGVELAMRSYQTVRVQPGDSVSEIAVRNYGQASPTILDMMKIANPSIRDIDVISIGQELRLPQLDEGFVILRQNGGYALLLISTEIQQRANEIEGALRERGFAARVRRADFGAGRLVNRVIIGNLNTRDDALDVGKRLQRLFREDERIAAMAR